MNPLEPSAVSHALLLLKAEQLTNQGRFREAEALFGGDDVRPPDDPLMLHGLAAVVTRSGDYLRARRLWRLLQHRQPGHREAERMLAALDCWEGRPRWVRLAPGASAALLVMTAAIWFWHAQTAPRPATAPNPAHATAVAPAQPAPTGATPPPQPAEETAPPIKFKMPPAKPTKR